MTATQFVHRLVWFVLAVWMLGLSGMVGFWMTDRTLPSVTYSIRPVSNEVWQGRFISVEWVIDRVKYCETTRSDHIIDAKNERWSMPQQQFVMQPGPLGREKIVTLTPIPMWIPTGQATLRVQLAYYCNPMQKWFTGPVTETSEVRFEIIPALEK